jgi:hypothetical protein
MMSRASKASWTGMPNSVMILVSLTLWLPRGFANFPKKPNFLIEVFPFRGLLLVGGSIASKSLDRCLQSGKVNGALVSDAMEVLEGASEWPVPRKKHGKSQRFSVRFSSLEGLLVNRGEFTLIFPLGPVKPFLMLMRGKGLEAFSGAER